MLRDERKQNPSLSVNDWVERCLAVFGPETDSAAEHAGALIVGDARLLALPVRSFKGTFGWVTSPLLLILAKRDLNCLGEEWVKLEPAQFSGGQRLAKVAANSNDALGCICVHDDKVYLQDLDLDSSPDAAVVAWAKMLRPLISPAGTDIFSSRFIVVDDDTMTFLWETATQVDQRVRIDGKTRTVVDGALWSEESLPPETLLIGLLEAGRSRKSGRDMEANEVLEIALPANKECILQFGGKATVGRGRCRMVAIG